jgi:hypothetical protein
MSPMPSDRQPTATASSGTSSSTPSSTDASSRLRGEVTSIRQVLAGKVVDQVEPY